MNPTNCFLKGFSPMGIAATSGFLKTDENVISIINNDMNPREMTDKKIIAKINIISLTTEAVKGNTARML